MTDTNRRTGRTTRMLLRAILAASEKPNQNVVVVGHNHAYARELAEKAWRMLPGGLNGDMRFHLAERRIELPNGSQLFFHTTCPEDYGDESWRIGRPDLQVFYDHFVGEALWPPRVRSAYDRLKEFAKSIGAEHLLKPAPWMSVYPGTFVGMDIGRGEDWSCIAEYVRPRRVTMADIDAERLSEKEVERLRDLTSRWNVWRRTGPRDPPCFFAREDDEERAALVRRRARVEALLQDYWATL